MFDIFTTKITSKVRIGILHKTGRKKSFISQLNFPLLIKLCLLWIPFFVNSIPTTKNQKLIFFCHTSSSKIISCRFWKIRISLQIGPLFSCTIEHFQIRCITPPLTFVIKIFKPYVFMSSNHYWLPIVQSHISIVIVINILWRSCLFPSLTIKARYTVRKCWSSREICKKIKTLTFLPAEFWHWGHFSYQPIKFHRKIRMNREFLYTFYCHLFGTAVQQSFLMSNHQFCLNRLNPFTCIRYS